MGGEHRPAGTRGAVSEAAGDARQTPAAVGTADGSRSAGERPTAGRRAATAPAGGKRSLSSRVFVTMFSISIVLIAVFSLAGSVFMQQRLASATRAELADEAEVVAASLNTAPSYTTLLRRLGIDNTRVTLIAVDGTVLFDSEEDPSTMGNHADRPEVAQAVQDGHGSSERPSSTLGEVMLYEAVRLADGSVVRLAQGQAGYLAIMGTLLVPLVLLAVGGAVVSVVVARRESSRIIAPLLEVDLDHPRRNAQRAYAEMEPMLERIESQRQELRRQMRVLADNDRMRREFTANITHELKTPLTAISGYAELIANGMVEAEEDQRDFGRRIYQEAGRLTALVNDILTLSNLDEAEHGDAQTAATSLGACEPVDLPRTLEGVEQRLEAVAARADVHLELACESALVEGVARLIDIMVYNLASNAIRYNRPAGTVELACGQAPGGGAFVRVRDTGIGIAEEERDKIFERFYRVDKSRSKARGGTGLGLAIVKHAALFHKATIEVQSELGEGTSITVHFPPAALLQAPQAPETASPQAV